MNPGDLSAVPTDLELGKLPAQIDPGTGKQTLQMFAFEGERLQTETVLPLPQMPKSGTVEAQSLGLKHAALP